MYIIVWLCRSWLISRRQFCSQMYNYNEVEVLRFEVQVLIYEVHLLLSEVQYVTFLQCQMSFSRSRIF